VKEVHQYFASRTPSNKNAKTGMFKDCNLILITAEAFSHLAVSEEMTPTLYSMMHEGFYFTDYYVPDWGVSTTDGEYAHLTGTVPKDGVWSFKRSSGNYMPLTMNQQLLKLGYNSYAYHGHTHTYYGRDQYLGNLGYNYKGLGGGLEVTKQWPESDVEVVDLSTADFVNQQPFSVYYMTISGHREFNFSGNSMAAKNKELVADLPYSNNVRAYIATQLELEHSMGLLLQRLEEAGVLENTVIVLTADHYPNGLTPEEMGELLGHTPESNFEIYRNGCIIWKPGMTPEVIDEPMSHLDLLPTVSNLFGLEFDSRLYMGRDVFSDAEPLVMFRNRSWITGDARYNSQTGKAEFFSGAESDTYVKSIKSEVGNRFAVSTRILDNDYWRILFAE
jgi:phosphoglycerol transferase MdoB-like AlkP superfamily enzyme